MLCDYYGGSGSDCRIRLTQFTIQKSLYTGADPEGFVRGLYDGKQETATTVRQREDIDRQIRENTIIESEFTMRGVDGAPLPHSTICVNDSRWDDGFVPAF